MRIIDFRKCYKTDGDTTKLGNSWKGPLRPVAVDFRDDSVMVHTIDDVYNHAWVAACELEVIELCQ